MAECSSSSSSSSVSASSSSSSESDSSSSNSGSSSSPSESSSSVSTSSHSSSYSSSVKCAGGGFHTFRCDDTIPAWVYMGTDANCDTSIAEGAGGWVQVGEDYAIFYCIATDCTDTVTSSSASLESGSVSYSVSMSDGSDSASFSAGSGSVSASESWSCSASAGSASASASGASSSWSSVSASESCSSISPSCSLSSVSGSGSCSWSSLSWPGSSSSVSGSSSTSRVSASGSASANSNYSGSASTSYVTERVCGDPPTPCALPGDPPYPCLPSSSGASASSSSGGPTPGERACTQEWRVDFNCKTNEFGPVRQTGYEFCIQIGGFEWPPVVNQWYLHSASADICKFRYVYAYNYGCQAQAYVCQDVPDYPPGPPALPTEAQLQSLCGCYEPACCTYTWTTVFDCETKTFSPVTLFSFDCLGCDSCDPHDWEILVEEATYCSYEKVECFTMSELGLTEPCHDDADCPDRPIPAEPASGDDCECEHCVHYWVSEYSCFDETPAWSTPNLLFTLCEVGEETPWVVDAEPGGASATRQTISVRCEETEDCTETPPTPDAPTDPVTCKVCIAKYGTSCLCDDVGGPCNWSAAIITEYQCLEDPVAGLNVWNVIQDEGYCTAYILEECAEWCLDSGDCTGFFCNTPDPTVPAEDCECKKCEYTWSSTYSCDTLSWSTPVLTDTQCVDDAEETDWDVVFTMPDGCSATKITVGDWCDEAGDCTPPEAPSISEECDNCQPEDCGDCDLDSGALAGYGTYEACLAALPAYPCQTYCEGQTGYEYCAVPGRYCEIDGPPYSIHCCCDRQECESPCTPLGYVNDYSTYASCASAGESADCHSNCLYNHLAEDCPDPKYQCIYSEVNDWWTLYCCCVPLVLPNTCIITCNFKGQTGCSTYGAVSWAGCVADTSGYPQYKCISGTYYYCRSWGVSPYKCSPTYSCETLYGGTGYNKCPFSHLCAPTCYASC